MKAEVDLSGRLAMSSQKLTLNKEQFEAVRHDSGPLLIIAGAGTGKTTVITERIKWLISQKLAKPEEIVALTFTEKAAREMEERVDMALPYGYTQMWISTFHSFCDNVLRDEALHIGLDPNFKLMTEAESVIFLKKHLFQFSLNYFRPHGNPHKFISGLLQHFSRLQDEDVSAEQYLQYAHPATSTASPAMSADRQAASRRPKAAKDEENKTLELARAYQKYQQLKNKENVMDFSDLISNTLKLFRTRANILKQYQQKFKYILVDEYQDTNISQNELVKLLAGPNGNLTCVCDDDQAIYKWRGAAVSNILQFRKTYPSAKIVSLTKNYRSTQTILNRAYDLIIHNNPDRLEVKEKINKKLISQRQKTGPARLALPAGRQADGQAIDLIITDRVENEAENVVKKIISLTKNGQYRYQDIAILVRANNHADPFVRALSRQNIPYQFLGPGQLLKQPEVKDLIAYLKVLDNFEDSVSMYRLLSMDIFNISARDIAALLNFARFNNLSLFEACELATDKMRINSDLNSSINSPAPRIGLDTKKKLAQIVSMIHRHLKLAQKETAGQILFYFLEDSGLLAKMAETKSVYQERQVQNIAKFFDKIKSFEAENEDASIANVVDWLTMKMEFRESPLATDIDWLDNNAVNILTIHSAKGLEFPVVFLVNLVAQRFPTRGRKEQIPIADDLIKEILPQGDSHLLEERRLFYVAMTRAKDRLFLTAANYYAEEKRQKKLSPFVVEALGEKRLKAMEPSSHLTMQQLSFLDYQKSSPQSSAQYPLSNIHYQIKYLSYSQIDTFKRCPLQYKYKNILKIPVKKSFAAIFGSTIHNSLHQFYRLAKNGEKVSQKTLMNLFQQNWSSEGYQSKEHETQYFQKGKKYLLEFFQQNFNSTHLPIVLEHNFKIPFQQGFLLGGKIDRVDQLAEGILEIIDYKTSQNIPDQKKIDQDLQMTVYALAATNQGIFKQKPEQLKLSFYYFEGQQKLSTKRSQEQLEKAKEEIAVTAKEIAQSDFKPTPSTPFPCNFCEYKIICEAWR